MGLVDAAPETLADVVNGLIEFGLCRQFNEALLHPNLVFWRLRKPELVDAKLKNPLEILVGGAGESKGCHSCAVSRSRRR